MNNFFSELKLKLADYRNSQLILNSSFKDRNNSLNYIVPKKFKKAAVLCLIEIKNKVNLSILLTLRSHKLKEHPGQISFPGGKANIHESLTDCALRETEEEIGLKKQNIVILGSLNMYLSGSNYLIKPVVGFINEEFDAKLNKAEVEKLIVFPINYLFNKDNIITNSYFDKSINQKMFYYDIKWKRYRIWGTTGIILVHLSKIISNVI